MIKRTLEEVCEYFQLYGAKELNGRVFLCDTKPIREGEYSTMCWDLPKDYTLMARFDRGIIEVDKNVQWHKSLYTPKSLRPTHKPYSSFLVTWIGTKVLNDCDDIFTIVGRDDKDNILIRDKRFIISAHSYKDLFKHFKKENGTLFGEEIEDEKD